MQKKIIALALAGLASSAAFAQSNVTVYGIIDNYYGNLSSTNVAAAATKKFSGVNSGGLSTSRLGFRGTEDLGNGLKANFVLEYQLSTDASGDAGGELNNARQETVGLSGGFGTVLAGRAPTAALGWAVKYQPLGGSAVDPLRNVVNVATASYAGGGLSTADRANNAVAYVSPTMGGVTVQYNHGFAAETKTVAGNGQRAADLLAADYDNGPLSVGVVYRAVGNLSDAGDRSGTKEWALGGKYNLGVATLFATYQSGKENVAVSAEKYKAYSLSTAVPVSAAGTVVASFADSKIDETGTTARGAKSYTLAYTHGLSKRTTAYTAFTSTDNKLNSTGTHYGIATEADKRVRGVVAGVRHSF